MIALAFLLVPLIAILADAPWGSFLTIISSPTALEALRISLIASVSAAGLVFVTGVPLAWILARDVLPGTRFWRALVIVPLLLPPVVSGVALLSAFGRRGLVGGWIYDLTGFQFPFSIAGVILAATFVALPFLVITVEGAIRSVDRDIEDAAAVDGASTRRIFQSITLLPSHQHLLQAPFWPGHVPWGSLEPPSHLRAISRDLPKPCPWRCTRHWSQIVTVLLP